MNYGTYYVLITAIIPAYEDMITTALVKSAYKVSALEANNLITISHPDSASALIALRIDAFDDDGNTMVQNASELHSKIEKILVDLKIMYYSLIVTDSCDCCWNIGNMQLTKALPPPIPNVRKTNSGLN